MHLTVSPLCGQRSIHSRGGEFQGIFRFLITHTWRGDERGQVVTTPLKRYIKLKQYIVFIRPLTAKPLCITLRYGVNFQTNYNNIVKNRSLAMLH